MSSPTPPFVPSADDGDDDDLATDAVPTVDDDGERVLDPDANDDLVDSARADRLAAGARDEDDAL